MNIEDELNIAQLYGIIDIADMRSKIEMVTRKELLDQHSYKIWSGKNNYWYTYIVKDSVRKQIKRSSRIKLEDYLVEFYKNNISITDFITDTCNVSDKLNDNLNSIEPCNNTKKDKSKTLFKDLYKEWLFGYKCLHVSKATISRIQYSYTKYYEKTYINDFYIEDIDNLILDIFLHKIIQDYDLDRKQYYNMSLILRQLISYALKKHLITDNPFNDFNLAKNMLAKRSKYNNETQVYLTNEQERMECKILEDFEDNPLYALPLAIVLAFQTGLRIGELATIKWEDVDYKQHLINICRIETTYRDFVDRNTKEYVRVSSVKESSKSSAGNRQVYLTPRAIQFLEYIKKSNQLNGYEEEYVFCNKNGRIRESSIDNVVRKYCRKIGIKPKSLHKIRKTYVSALLDVGLNVDEVRRLAGHEKSATTFDCYCFNRFGQNETTDKINIALGN